MKQLVLLLSVAATLVSGVGCNALQNRKCNSCNGAIGCRPCSIAWQRGGTDYGRHLSNSGQFNGNGGPATAQTAYPYYTTRGPRDFFANDPPTIGR